MDCPKGYTMGPNGVCHSSGYAIGGSVPIGDQRDSCEQNCAEAFSGCNGGGGYSMGSCPCSCCHFQVSHYGGPNDDITYGNCDCQNCNNQYMMCLWSCHYSGYSGGYSGGSRRNIDLGGGMGNMGSGASGTGRRMGGPIRRIKRRRRRR